MANGIVTIPSKITKGEELVVIPRSLYEQFFVRQEPKKKTRRAKEIREILAKVERGRKACKEGKTYVLKSPSQLLSG